MESMDDIYRRHAMTVYKFLLSKTHNEHIAQELTQETFYQAIKSIDRFDGTCKISTWLCAIAKNQLSVYRRRNPVSDDEVLSRCIVSSAESQVFEKTEKVDLIRKIHLLPEPFREIIYLRVYGDLSFSEIGGVLGKTENWARVNFHRGKEKLFKELKDDEK